MKLTEFAGELNRISLAVNILVTLRQMPEESRIVREMNNFLTLMQEHMEKDFDRLCKRWEEAKEGTAFSIPSLILEE